MAEPDQAQQPRRNGKSAAAFRTISEVAVDLEVPPHVLRFWESKFSQVRPLKRGGGRRYYRPEDVALLERIRELLYREGYTIKGVQKLLRDGAVRMPTAGEAARAAHATSPRKGGNTGTAPRPETAVIAASNDAGPVGEAARTNEVARVTVEAPADGAEAATGKDARGQLTSVLKELKALKQILADARR